MGKPLQRVRIIARISIGHSQTRHHHLRFRRRHAYMQTRSLRCMTRSKHDFATAIAADQDERLVRRR